MTTPERATNFVDTDAALLPLIERYVAPEDRALLLPLVDRLGADVATRLTDAADLADKNPPQLRSYDRSGERIDAIDFHPAYDELAEAAFEDYALAAISHRPVHGWTQTPPHLAKYVLSHLFVQAEFGIGCPVNMTDAAARTLKMFGDPERFGEVIERLTSTDPRDRLTGAMFMTEISGGTDIAQTETIAEPEGDDWKLTGRKWFASNASADVILTLARFPGGEPDSTRGVGLFMVPRLRPDGSRNSYTIDRLKDKLGTKSMASGEVTLNGAYAVQVGQLDRGFRQMAEMVNTSRLSNAMRASALMRRGITEATSWARARVVFGKRLVEQPLMQLTLLSMQVEAEAGLGMVFYCADTLQQADSGDAQAKQLIRVLTPIAKHYLCKRARVVTGEAMEVLGGNGYIEDWPMARVVRDAHLGSIWEGSSNVIALDVLRCMRQFAAHELVAEVMSAKLSGLPAPYAADAQWLTAHWASLVTRGQRILAADGASGEALMGRYTDALARAALASLLLEQAAYEGNEERGYRKLLVASVYIALLRDPDAELPAGVLAAADDVIAGNPVPLSIASSVSEGSAVDVDHLTGDMAGSR
ncbi:acyl-CoA dehydrogenase [Epidermidibacterium keratini]|uniref:Acyl-CoA dehydrogenase n=1 Tax=Epidermidibacterium keratini TaxID=1891644 RepID=A0A7L4YPY6_9ACTN|nr:acyl-CoA dehydrogenase family protein [Epidermidibacterium keratini]QHC01226.1 acyl-CoA dehydrogenase [Epidermidibacterium keratini]